MKTCQYLTILAVTFLITSCATSTFYYRELPPELVLPESVKEVTVVSAFDPSLLDFRPKKNVVFSAGSKELIGGLSNEIEQRTELAVQHIENPIEGDVRFQYEPDSIDRTARAEFAQERGAAHLLVLEAFSLDFDQEMEVVKEDDGSKTRTAHYDLIATANINLYDDAGNLIDEVAIETIHPDYDSRNVISGLLAAGPSMAKAGKEVNELCREIGAVWVDQLFPSQIQVERFIYNNKVLKESTQALMGQDWERAIELLTPLTSNPDQKISGKASYNLSVAYEALDELDLSDQWREEAVEKLGKSNLLDGRL